MEKTGNSHLKIFMKLTSLRTEDVLRRGSYLGKLANNDNVIVYLRSYGGKNALIALNFGLNTETINFKEHFPVLSDDSVLPDTLTVYTASLDSGIEER